MTPDDLTASVPASPRPATAAARPTPRWALLALGYLVAVLVGIAFAHWLRQSGDWDAGLAWERDLLYRVHGRSLPRVVDGYLFVVPWLGTNLTLLPAALVVSLWLLARRRRDLALWLMTVELGGLSLNWLIKHLTARARPALWERVGWYGWGSYPSGHALVSIAVLGTAALMLYRERGWRWPALVAAVLIPSVVYSRLYHGVHWPADMIGGAAVGVVWLVVTARAFDRPRAARPPAPSAAAATREAATRSGPAAPRSPRG